MVSDRPSSGAAVFPNKTPFYITTAISYPNGAPHIGHAYEAIAADAIARFHRLEGDDVLFVTGTDEHGQKMVRAAAAEGLSPRQLRDRNVPLFEGMAERLRISHDDFIHTTEQRHKLAAAEIWRRMAAAGDVYLGKYAGWYSVRDESYYDEDETHVADGRRVATSTGTPVEWVEEDSYFFRLSAYRDRLLDLYARVPDFVSPKERLNEVTSFVDGNLRDLSISRASLDWGIPVPSDPAHVMYVWVDALTNYITATGFPLDGQRFRRYWPADVHVIGKDIVRFHAVFWPAFLMSAGLPVPKRIFAHGFLFNRGAKMSKSTGNVIAPDDLVSEFGVDRLRYFLLREVPFGQDGNYTREAIAVRSNADLSNDLGNLAQRCLAIVAKTGGLVPSPGPLAPADVALLAGSDEALDRVREHMMDLAPHEALAGIWSLVGDANRYFASQQPWALAKSDPGRQAAVLHVTLEVLRRVGLLLQPFVPDTARSLLDQVGAGPDRDFGAYGSPLAAGTALPPPEPLFPRLRTEPRAELGDGSPGPI